VAKLLDAGQKARKKAKSKGSAPIPAHLRKKEHVNHWIRRVLDEETDKIVSSWDTATLDAIEISGTAWRNAGFRHYQSLQYPQFNICDPADSWSEENMRLAQGSADVILAEQVWEHLRYPYRAGKNVFSMLRPGGRFLLTTPFLVRIHGIESYSDCTRWTTEGMACFLEECGFDPAQIQTFAWGNKECAASHVQNEMWFEYQKGMNLENDPIYPCVVWAVATKQR
jgi:SAM-dependent methyltransferase